MLLRTHIVDKTMIALLHYGCVLMCTWGRELMREKARARETEREREGGRERRGEGDGEGLTGCRMLKVYNVQPPCRPETLPQMNNFSCCSALNHKFASTEIQ